MDKVGSPFDSETESEQPKAGNGVADSFKNRIDKVDQSKGDIAIMQASSNNNGVKVKPEISGKVKNFPKLFLVGAFPKKSARLLHWVVFFSSL